MMQDPFVSFQKQLVDFSNFKLARRFLGFDHQIPPEAKVVKVSKNGLHYIARPNIITYSMCSRPVIEMKLKKALQSGAWAASLLAQQFASNPEYALAVILGSQTYYSDASPETDTVDGTVEYWGPEGSGWGVTFNASVGTGKTDGHANRDMEVSQGQTIASTKYDHILTRGMFLYDTSGLSANAIITAATWQIYCNSKVDTASIGWYLVLCNPANVTNLIPDDYDQVTRIDQSSYKACSAISTSAYNTFTLNSTGRGNISKSGLSKFGLIGSSDFLSTPTPSAKVNRINIDFADGSNKPKLNVSYKIPGGLFFSS